MLRISSFRFVSTITKYSNSSCAREATTPWGWSTVHNIPFSARAAFVRSACWLPRPPCLPVMGRGADGQPSLRTVDSSCQTRLLEIWVTLSKNRLLPRADASRSTHPARQLGSARSGRRSLTGLAQHHPVSGDSSDKAATRSCSLLRFEPGSEMLTVMDVHLFCAFPWGSCCCSWALHLADDSRKDSTPFLLTLNFSACF